MSISLSLSLPAPASHNVNSTSTSVTLSAMCQAQITRNNLVSRLSPGGQENLTKIGMDVQYTTGAIAQQVWNFIGIIYGVSVAKISSTSDASKLNQLGQVLGYNNYTFGAGPMQDLCALQSTVKNLVASFSSANQHSVQTILNAYLSGLKGLSNSVLVIVNHFNAPILNYLNKTENSTILNALAVYEYPYNFL